MKMVKSLLLGSAAGLVAVAGAQAADLPVKAKPVEYVKICSLYGVGFYYIPGTDMCIKIGGYVRAETAWGTNGTSTNVKRMATCNNRYTNNSWYRVLAATSRPMPATRPNTVRCAAISRVGCQHRHDRLIRSHDVQREPRLHPVGGLHVRPRAVVLRLLLAGGGGILGLHAELRHRRRRLGSGWPILPSSATASRPRISAEDRRTTQIIGQGIDAWYPTASVNGLGVPGLVSLRTSASSMAVLLRHKHGLGYGGWQAPDIVGNLRVDQAWGSAQIGGAAHQVNATILHQRTSRRVYPGKSFRQPRVTNGAGPPWLASAEHAVAP